MKLLHVHMNLLHEYHTFEQGDQISLILSLMITIEVETVCNLLGLYVIGVQILGYVSVV